MSRIIALQGKGNSGKTTTINLLPDILRRNGYRSVPGSFQNHGQDFLEIFEKGTNRVGVTSAGDTYNIVHTRLTHLVRAGCNICICACRTKDRIPPGTVAAVRSISGYVAHFVPKTVAGSPALELRANANDANSLFSSI